MNHQDTKDTKVGGKGGCALLDDYLDGELDACEVAAFEGHLVGCAACAEAIEQQRWMDGALRSAAAELESAPADVKFATAAAIEKLQRRQTRRRTLAVFASAAAMAVVWAWPASPLPRREGTGEGFVSVAADSPARSEAAVERPSPSPSLYGRGIGEASFVSGGDAIAVPVESASEEVTIVQVFPTFDAQRRVQLNTALSSMGSEPNGG